MTSTTITRFLARPRPLLICLLVFLLLALSWLGYSRARKDVTLEADGGKRLVHTFKARVGELLTEQGITMGPADLVEPGPGAVLGDGLQIRVVRAFPVTVMADGEVVQQLTLPAKVQDVLVKAGVVAGELDRVSPALDTSLASETTVEVTRVTQREASETRALSYKVERRPDSSLEKGITKLVRRGKQGQERITYRVTYEEGNEVAREEVAREITSQPVDEILAVGVLQLASRGGENFRFQRAMVATASAYTATGRRTYTGTIPQVGTVAVDPKSIPLGSKLYIEGYGYAKAQDIGSAIKGERIDVYLDSLAQARAWGIRKVKLYILED